MLRDRIQTLPAIVTALSGVAVIIAAVALVVTHGHGDDTTTATVSPTTSAKPSVSSKPSASTKPTVTPTATTSTSAPAISTSPTASAPSIDRKTVDVFVYNDTATTGLASKAAAKVSKLGWHVVGTGNWHETTPSTTVYYPSKLKAAAQLLAKDLGIKRVHLGDASLSSTRLTVVLEGPLS